MQQETSGQPRSSKWLTAGPGFGLVVALVGAALSFVVVTYTSTLRDQERLYKSQVAMLASLMDEVDVNRQRAKKNLEEFTKAVALKGDFIPTPERYMVHTWNSVSSSEALTTALAPGMFSYLSQYYEEIENQNRRYTQWEDGLYGLVVAAGSWTQEEKRATQANRRTWFRQRQGMAKVIHDQYIPGLKKVLDTSLRIAQSELAIVNIRMRMAWTFVVPVALVAGLAFLRAAAELLPSRQRKPTQPAGADAPGPSSEAD
ncbi:MAG: hypothetical protein RDU83_13970 [bacterium]|nr:hypothetical protein [bacterium]